MTTCPYCSHSLLNHLRPHNRYWYCKYCRLEISPSFIAAKDRKTLHQSLSSNRDRASLITTNLSI